MLRVRQLRVVFPGEPPLVAVNDVSIEIGRAEVAGLVGESGSGKSTLARAIAGITPVDDGQIAINGADRTNPTGTALRALRRQVQLIWQDPRSSLDPRMSVGAAIAEAAAAAGLDRRGARKRAEELFGLAQLPVAAIDNYPHQFSGGQLQRVAIARALAADPEVLLLDEVTAALDVSVQAKILNLLREIQAELGLTLLYISHDLSVIRYLSRRVYVMNLGRIVESGPVDAIFAAPKQQYTQRLIAAVPTLGGGRVRTGPQSEAVHTKTRGTHPKERNAKR